MLGVFEIDQEHEFYSLTCAMKTGLKTAFLNPPDTHPLGFEMQTFAGPVFSSLRCSLGLREEEYRTSLASDAFYLQFISNSKSKADFFITHDKRFFLKTQSRREVKFLLSNLLLYVDHLNQYPHSLLVRFLGGERSWFEEQVELDSVFLRRLNVLDYSILLAQQPLHQDELDQRHSLAQLVSRTTKSLDLDEGPVATDPPSRPLLERQLSVRGAAPEDPGLSPGDGIPLRTLPGGGAEADFHARHRRLLPDSRNPLHVVDGLESRYFVGIIDVFTVYNWRKKLEHFYKVVRFPGQAFSTVSPADYSLRFCQWVRRHTQ
ncbi:unnamed protein product [Merluccius merluccius]